MEQLPPEFAIDREGPVPAFYVLTKPQQSTFAGTPGQHVFAENDKHFSRAWITVGVVSAQSPFGQGGGFGIPRADLREATPAEIRRAVQRHHFYEGESFTPSMRSPGHPALRHWRKTSRAQVDLVLRSLR